MADWNEKWSIALNQNRSYILGVLQYSCNNSSMMNLLRQYCLISRENYTFVQYERQPGKQAEYMYSVFEQMSQANVLKMIDVLDKGSNVVSALKEILSSVDKICAQTTRQHEDGSSTQRHCTSVLDPLVTLVKQMAPIVSADATRSSIRQLLRSYNLCDSMEKDPIPIALDKIGMVMCGCAGLEQQRLFQWISRDEWEAAAPIMSTIQKSAQELLATLNGGRLCVETEKFPNVKRGIPGAVQFMLDNMSKCQNSIKIEDDKIKVFIGNGNKKLFSETEWNVLTVVLGVVLALLNTSFCIVKMVSNVPVFLFTKEVLDMSRIHDVLQSSDVGFVRDSLKRCESVTTHMVGVESCPF